MHTTNYTDTLILVAPDCPLTQATVPEKPGTVAKLQHDMVSAVPYTMTSDDLMVAVEATRKEIADRDALRASIFAKPQACLRASPLVKTYGWGIHHDAQSRIALVPVESAEYARLAADPAVAKVTGMRSAHK